MKKLLFLGLILSIVSHASAEKHIDGNSSFNVDNGGGKTGVFDCSPSASQIDLDINNVRARILGGGDFWWDGVETPRYEVPKVDPASGATPLNVLFAGALWFTGLDNGGNLQCASQTFRNQGHDFFNGPLSGNFGEVSFDVCEAYDEHFKVYGPDIARLRALFSVGNTVTRAEILAIQDPGDPNSDPLEILRWPGKGNPYYLENETDKYYNESSMAPFFDVDGNDIYDPTKGDFPVIGVSDNGVLTENFADQMIFWVINDNGNIHGRTGGTPIGVQVNCLAFAYQTADALDDMTFYTFEITKKSPNPLFETFMGIFVDPDLGTATDDYVGCDTIREMGFLYNANAVDQLYGANPPIVGIDYFEGPLDDDGNQLGLSSFVFFINSGPANQQDPDDAPEFRNFQTGKWKDGTPITFGGGGIGGAVPTNYCLSGNPDDPSPLQWSAAQTTQLTGDDYRFVQNSGPFTLQPGDPQRISIGAMTVFPDNYDGTPDIEAELGIADDLAQNLFDNNFDIIDGPDAPTLAIRELPNELVINLVNEPSSNNFGESYQENHALPDNGVLTNGTTYDFQGYAVYQLKSDQVTAQDLDDAGQAKLIFQGDLKDGLADIYNYSNNGVGFYNANLKVAGADEGITRTLVVLEDAFATDEKALVNNKKYYFAAISYAAADYNPFPNIPTLPELEIFKQGRGNFKIYSAIPHVIDSRNGGTILQAKANDPLTVFRFEGEGNGGVAIRLSEATEDAILEPPFYFEDILEYDLGADPIRAKVVDPLKLQNVNFELVFESYRFVNDTVIGPDTLDIYVAATEFSDSSYWKIFVTNDLGTPIDTILADRDFNRQYEQVITDYGISVNVDIPAPGNVNLVNGNNVYPMITSAITFADPTARWLSFIKDEGFASPSNWIRDGAGAVTTTDPTLRGIFDSHQYDELSGSQADEFYDISTTTIPSLFGTSILDGSIAPYCLASNYGNPSVGNPPVIAEGRPEYLFGPAFRWDRWDVPGTLTEVKNPVNNLDDLRSVSIVFSNDPSEWSDCVVFETGDRLAFTSDNVPKGGLRSDDGAGPRMGQFPGYAINVETGERLNIAFGESSELGAYKGTDQVWNPTSDIEDVNTPVPGLDGAFNNPIWGGKHFVYVFKTRYDNGADAFSALTNNTINSSPNQVIPTDIADVYNDIIYTFIPIVEEEYEWVFNPVIPTTTRIDINVARPFTAFATAETSTANGNNTLPRYRFSTEGLAPLENQTELAESVLDNIRVVPNPYYAFSAYEENQVDSEVKIIGLPDKCKVSIFTLDGKLVRQFDRAVGTAANTESVRQELSDGQAINSGINLDNSISWDLNNSQRIPIGSGSYIIHIDAFELGEEVVKAAVFMRPTDVSNF
jgi:hypothetical protein